MEMNKRKTNIEKYLEQFVREEFKGNNEIKKFISERGNQRSEIKDLDTGEIWQTLEGTIPNENLNDFTEISASMLSALIQQSFNLKNKN